MIRPEIRLRAVIAALSALGVGVATYIAIAEAGGGSPQCLAGGGGCETVAESAYSEIAGVNVAAVGIAGYLAVLLTAAVPGDLGRMGGFLFALIGFGFTLYLTYLELFVIDAICQWCVVSAVVMTLLLVACAARAAMYAATDTPQSATPGGSGQTQGGSTE